MPPAVPGRARRARPESGVGAEGFGSPHARFLAKRASAPHREATSQTRDLRNPGTRPGAQGGGISAAPPHARFHAKSAPAPHREATSQTRNLRDPETRPGAQGGGTSPPQSAPTQRRGLAPCGAGPNRMRPAHRERRSAASRTKTRAFPGFSARGRGSKNRRAASRPTVGLAFRPSSRKEGEGSVFRLPARSPPQNRHWGSPLPGTWKTNPSSTTSPTPGAR